MAGSHSSRHGSSERQKSGSSSHRSSHHSSRHSSRSHGSQNPSPHGRSSGRGKTSATQDASHRPVSAELSSDMLHPLSHSCRELFYAVMNNVNRSRLKTKQQEGIEKLRHILRRDKRHPSEPIDWAAELSDVATACDDIVFNGRLRSTNAVAYIPEDNLYATTGASGNTMTDPATYGDSRAYIRFDTRIDTYWREVCDTRAKKRTAIIAALLHEQLHAWAQRFGCTCEACTGAEGDRTIWCLGLHDDGHGVGWRFAANAVGRKLLQWIPELEWHSEQSKWSFWDNSDKNRIDALTVIHHIPEDALGDMEVDEMTDEEEYWNTCYSEEA